MFGAPKCGARTSSSSISVQTTHCNTKKRSHSQELVVCTTKSSTELQYNEENIVNNERPLSSIPISSKTKDDRSNTAQHKHERDTPGNISLGLAERLSKRLDSQRDSKEVECVPSPSEEGNKEEEPLLKIEHAQERDRVGHFVMSRLQRRNARSDVSSRRHLSVWVLIIFVSRIVRLFVVHDGGLCLNSSRRE